MAKAEESVSILTSPKNVWYRLIEFNRWDEWFRIPDAGKKGLGEHMQPLGGEGTEMRFGLFSDKTLMQTLRVTEWDPPKRLAMALEGWNWRAAIRAPYKDIPEKRGQMVGNWGALALSLSAEVSPVSDSEAKLVFRMEASFTHPIFGPFLNLVYPVRRQLSSIAADFTARFTQSFEKRGAA